MRRNRRLVMLLIILLGLGVIVWDFFRPPRPAGVKPGGAPPPADRPR
jgi:hypothetical protein